MNRMKRLLAIVLAFVFMLSCATAVSAADVQWHVGDEYYAANVTCTQQSGDIAIFTNTTMYHWRNDYNMYTIIRAGGDYSITKDILWYPEEPDHYTWIEELLSLEGLCTSATFNIYQGQQVTIPATADTGEYKICASYYTSDGYWCVFDVSNGSAVELEGGSFYNAPLASEYYITYYKVG